MESRHFAISPQFKTFTSMRPPTDRWKKSLRALVSPAGCQERLPKSLGPLAGVGRKFCEQSTSSVAKSGRCASSRFRLLSIMLAAQLVSGVGWRAGGCGIDWSLPSNHFDGVSDEGGYVSYWEQIGELDLGEGLKLPININFRSNRESSSPYLGKGWTLALLESRIVQTGERDFTLFQPEGRFRTFGRSKANPLLLNGQGGWKAEIKGDTISAWADCGWKLTFVRGRITSITTPKNRRLDYIYSANRVAEIKEGGNSRLTVESDVRANQPKALHFNGHRLQIDQDEKPRIDVIGGKNLIGGLEPSLSRLSGSASDKTYKFSVNAQTYPTLTITRPGYKDRVLTWDPSTRRIVSNGELTYSFGATKEWQTDIRCVDAQGRYAFWQQRNGKEIFRDFNGMETEYDTFAGGVLAGRLRKIVSTYPDGTSSATNFKYDEKGNNIATRELHASRTKNTEINNLFSDNSVSISDGKANFILTANELVKVKSPKNQNKEN